MVAVTPPSVFSRAEKNDKENTESPRFDTNLSVVCEAKTPNIGERGSWKTVYESVMLVNEICSVRAVRWVLCGMDPKKEEEGVVMCRLRDARPDIVQLNAVTGGGA